MSRPATILIVDDTPENIQLLSDVLTPAYKVKAALNGERALTIAVSDPVPDMILLDVMMPGLDGLEVCRRLKANPKSAAIPVIFVTGLAEEQNEERGLALGAVDYITKPISPPIVRARVKTHLALYRQNLELEAKVRERTEELLRTRQEIIRRLGRAAEFRDNETGLHVIRMSHYAHLLARGLRISDDWADLVMNAAPMHDVGKIGVPDHILLKPGRLDAGEWAVMSRHPRIGADIIGDHPSEILRMAREIALGHHEKWDGGGYPQGLRGAAIPLAARIAAIADVFDALTSARPYKPAWPVEEAKNFMIEQSGRHFDPHLMDIFGEVFGDLLEIRRQHADRPEDEPG